MSGRIQSKPSSATLTIHLALPKSLYDAVQEEAKARQMSTSYFGRQLLEYALAHLRPAEPQSLFKDDEP